MLTDKLQVQPYIIEKTSVDDGDSQIGNALLTGKEKVYPYSDKYQNHIQQRKNAFFFRDPANLTDSEIKEICKHDKTDDMAGIS